MLQLERRPRRLRSFGDVYGKVAIVLLNGVVAFALANLLLSAFPSLRSSRAVETPLTIFGVDRLLVAYPGWSTRELVRLHNESRVVFEYEPILEFKIRPLSGRYVNVSNHGFRFNANPPPWPPRANTFNVFVFGGSTTFGWLLPDADTIVSQLQDLTASAGCQESIAFYNFAHPSYISTQERLLFQSLVMEGTIPNLAIFVDGVNDFFYRGQMAFTSSLRLMMERSDLEHRLGPLVNLPLYSLARRLRARLFYSPPVMDPATEAEIFTGVIAKWTRNRQAIEAIGTQYGVDTVFVWQPVPSFKYDIGSHFLYRQRPLAPGERIPYDDIGRAYGVMSIARPELERDRRFLWLADIQENRQENFYVDRIHYTAKFSREIADRILRFLNTRRPSAQTDCLGVPVPAERISADRSAP